MRKNNSLTYRFNLLLLIISYLSISQNIQSQFKIYFDENWKTTTKKEAHFYRILSKKNDTLFHVKDFYIAGALQMEGHFSNVEKEIFEGEIVWYTAEGSIIKKDNYKNGELHGFRTVYHENGKIDYTTEYIDGKIYNGIYIGSAAIANYKEFYRKGKLIKKVESDAVNDYHNLKTKIYGVKRDTIYWMNNKGDKVIGIGIYSSSSSEIIDGLDIKTSWAIAVHTNYKNGKREGIQKVFRTGKLLTEQTFVNDVVILERSINPLTRETVEVNFKEGEPFDGRIFQFDEKRDGYNEFIFEKGEIMIKNRYDLIDEKLELNEEKSYTKKL